MYTEFLKIYFREYNFINTIKHLKMNNFQLLNAEDPFKFDGKSLTYFFCPVTRSHLMSND